MLPAVGFSPLHPALQHRLKLDSNRKRNVLNECVDAKIGSKIVVVDDNVATSRQEISVMVFTLYECQLMIGQFIGMLGL